MGKIDTRFVALAILPSDVYDWCEGDDSFGPVNDENWLAGIAIQATSHLRKLLWNSGFASMQTDYDACIARAVKEWNDTRREEYEEFHAKD